MDKLKKLVCILIVITLCAMPVIVSAESTGTDVPSVTRVNEILELREPNAETYLLSDGSYECVVYSRDKYYYDSNNSLKLINNSIIQNNTSSKDIWAYKNSANNFDVLFSDSNNPAITLESDDYKLTFSPIQEPEGEKGLLAESSAHIRIGRVANCEPLEKLTYTGDNTITYHDVFDSTDFVYVLDNNVLKEYIILKDSKAPRVFSFSFETNGLVVKTDSNSLYFENEEKETVFSLSQLFAVDANDVLTETVSYEVIPTSSKNKIIVKVTLDEAYFSDLDREFPIIIDPSVMVSGESITYDTYVTERYPNLTNSSVSYLRTGRDEDFYTRRTYIKFVIPSSVSSFVSSAQLCLKHYSGSVPTTYAYRVLTDWSSSTVTWNNKPNYTTTNASGVSTASSDNWYRMNVTNIVQKWQDGTYSNYGFLVKDTRETDTSIWTTFYSSEGGYPNRPELRIVYYESQKIPLIGVTTTNHDHSTCLHNAKPYLDACDLGTAFFRDGAFDCEDIAAYLNDDDNGMFVSRSHGAKITGNVGTAIILNNNESSPVYFRSTTNLNNLDLSNMKLILFIGCYTGYGGRYGPNLPYSAVTQGATTAMGFPDSIICDKANEWTVSFAQYMQQGYSVSSACSLLSNDSRFSGSTLASPVICGNQYTTIN